MIKTVINILVFRPPTGIHKMILTAVWFQTALANGTNQLFSIWIISFKLFDISAGSYLFSIAYRSHDWILSFVRWRDISSVGTVIDLITSINDRFKLICWYQLWQTYTIMIQFFRFYLLSNISIEISSYLAQWYFAFSKTFFPRITSIPRQLRHNCLSLIFQMFQLQFIKIVKILTRTFSLFSPS
jgi:hypothetical protein